MAIAIGNNQFAGIESLKPDVLGFAGVTSTT
jgi:hypothetical protein